MGWPARWAHPLTALALTVALGACTTTSADQTPTTTGTTAAETASEPSPAATTTPRESEQGRLAQLWEAVHAERLRQLHSDAEPDAAAFEEHTTEDATEALLDHIRAGRSDVAVELVDTEHWTAVEISAGGRTAEIADCLIIAERPASDAEADPTVRSRVWTATATNTEDGWKLDSISAGVNDCVPPELNQQLLDAYAAYHEAWTAAWDPPDPDHPRLEDTMTGQRLTEIREQLREDQAAGIAFRDPHDPTANAVVFELGIGTATVSDCHPADPGYGAFDVESGERREDVIRPPRPDELHLTSVDLVRTDDGSWKVVESALLTDSNCTPGGTPYVVAP